MGSETRKVAAVTIQMLRGRASTDVLQESRLARSQRCLTCGRFALGRRLLPDEVTPFSGYGLVAFIGCRCDAWMCLRETQALVGEAAGPWLWEGASFRN